MSWGPPEPGPPPPELEPRKPWWRTATVVLAVVAIAYVGLALLQAAFAP